MTEYPLRPDLAIIARWIRPGSRVLDLGCGDGTLLRHLRDTREVTGYGLEIDAENIVRCIESDVNVIRMDLDRGLDAFATDSFDYVVLTQALQVVQRPDHLLEEMLRIGRESIVTFPNFGHWHCRLQLSLRGHMPVTPSLPDEWYDTPNIHLCTVRDFERLCAQKNLRILARNVVDRHHRSNFWMRSMPNLLGQVALYSLKRNGTPAAGETSTT